MADAVARREARRRRILENSENRLRIISGLTKLDSSEETTDLVQTTQKEVQAASLSVKEETEASLTTSDVSPNSGNHKVLPPEKSVDSQSTSRHDNHLMEPVIPPVVNSMGATLPLSELPKSMFSTLVEARLYLVGLAIMVRLLLSSNHGYLFGDSIFVPLFTIQLVRYFGIATSNNSNGGMINAALILSGLSSRQISFLTKTFRIFKDCLTDFYIYFFTFIILHVLLEST